MDFHSATRLAQQVYAERIQAASASPMSLHQEYQGQDRRPAGKIMAGWRGLLGRIANRRAQALGVEPPARPGRPVGV